ncbi:MAG: hypothetical protein K9K67_10915 [Bacteriovoracaceae bacterium]|nr:hypothetical protein [Bacteriovoracaceae bacterium]
MIKPKLMAITLLLISSNVGATNAQFEIKVNFVRNPKIWGTYKLANERVKISRGKSVWKKAPPQRIGDVIISKDNLIFVRENKINNQTKMVVDKIPYTKNGKKTYNVLPEEHQDKLSRLFDEDLKKLIPHQDLLNAEIFYQSMNCKKKRAHLMCTFSGEMSPASI